MPFREFYIIFNWKFRGDGSSGKCQGQEIWLKTKYRAYFRIQENDEWSIKRCQNEKVEQEKRDIEEKMN